MVLLALALVFGFAGVPSQAAAATLVATIPVGLNPARVAVTPDGTRAYVTNLHQHTVSVIDTASDTVTATVAVSSPHGLAIAPDGARAYVTNHLLDTVSVIDTATNTIAATIRVGIRPIWVTITPDGARAYVTNDVSRSMSVIDTATNTVIATVGLESGRQPTSVAFTPDGAHAYVGFSGNDSLVRVFDTATHAVIAAIAVAPYAWEVAISPDGTKAYVTGYGPIRVIDTATRTVTGTIAVGSGTRGVAFSPDGTHAYATNPAGTIAVIDTATDTVTDTIAVGDLPGAVAVTPDGTKAYVNNFEGATVSVLSTNRPPAVDAGGPYAGQEGTSVSVAGLVTDPDGPSLSTLWSAAPAAGVDPGATCTFSDASALSTTVACTDDGVWTLRLSANDSLNPDVVTTAQLTLTNAAPQLSVSAPADGALARRGTPVSITAPFTDAATSDTHTCTVDFDDGTPAVPGTVAQGAGSGTCTATHTYTDVGPHQALVTLTDDDGGSAAAVVTIVSYVNGEAWGVDANGPINLAKTPRAACPPNSNLTSPSITVPGLATVQTPQATCTLDPATGHTDASATIPGATLLGGLIRITDIGTQCQATNNGLTGTTRVGTINGQPIGTTPTTINLLGTAVHANQTVTTPDGQLAQYALRIVTPLGQQITLAGCRLGF